MSLTLAILNSEYAGGAESNPLVNAPQAVIPVALGIGYLIAAIGKGPDEIKQQIINNIDVDIVTEAFTENWADTKKCTFKATNQTIIICECQIGGSIIQKSGYNDDTEILIASDTSLTGNAANNISSVIANQLVQAVNKVETDIATILSGLSKSTLLDQEGQNIFKTAVQTRMSVSTYLSIAETSYDITSQTIFCGPGSVIKGDIIQTSKTVKKFIAETSLSSALGAVVTNQAMLEWVNNVNQDLMITRVGPMAIFAIILGIVAVIILVIGAVWFTFPLIFKRNVKSVSSQK